MAKVTMGKATTEYYVSKLLLKLNTGCNSVI